MACNCNNITVIHSVVPATCGQNNGQIIPSYAVSGGSSVAEFTFVWTGPSGYASGSSGTLTNLMGGDYTLQLFCGDSLCGSYEVNVPAFTAPEVEEVTIQNTCNGVKNGSITLEITGGVAPYTVNWECPDEIDRTGEEISNLPAGDYHYVITDAGGCSLEGDARIIEFLPISATVTVTATTDGCHCNNKATVSVFPSHYPPYTFEWDEATVDDTGDTFSRASGICNGTHQVKITDSNGCSLIKEFTIAGPVQYVPYTGPILVKETCPDCNRCKLNITDYEARLKLALDASDTVRKRLTSLGSGAMFIGNPERTEQYFNDLNDFHYLLAYLGIIYYQQQQDILYSPVNLPQDVTYYRDKYNIVCIENYFTCKGYNIQQILDAFDVAKPAVFKSTTSVSTSSGSVQSPPITSNADFVIGIDESNSINEEMWQITLKRWWSQGDKEPYIDVYGEPHFSRLQALNARGASIMGDSENHLTYVMIGDYFASGGSRIGNGLNCHQKAWPSTTCVYGETGGVGNNICCHDYDKAFIPLMVDLCIMLGYKITFIANAGHWDVAAFSANYNNWKVTKGGTINRVHAGMENSIAGYDNSVVWPHGEVEYVPAAQQINDDVIAIEPGLKVVGDTKDITKPNAADWNSLLDTTTLPEVRCYLTDDSFGFSADSATVDQAKNVIDVLVPARLQAWKDQFPGKKLVVAQYGALGNSMLASLYLADLHRQMVMWNYSNGDFISAAYLFRPAFWYLNSPKPKNIYYAALLIGMMYKYTGGLQQLNVSGPSGLRIWCIYKASKFMMQVINYSANTYPISSVVDSDLDPLSLLSCWAQYGTSKSDINPTYADLTADPKINPFSVTTMEFEYP